MEQASQLNSKVVSKNQDMRPAQHPQLAMRTEKIDRAAADLHADFQRQHGYLNQAQFDRLVLQPFAFFP